MTRKILMLVEDFVDDYEGTVPFPALLTVGAAAGDPLRRVGHDTSVQSNSSRRDERKLRR